ncbi:RNA polymerase sigma factor [Streptomyces iconiensis]|uniref:Sigma factor-like helix-turn-helix DNA-binding protein n=1 Tax=Streptomyces iconiensis TaxID=1384038 RepID=A0ABT6ZQW6_9ACTN|nr:sigma factor-like helix-turn-helix DNA-binding protein [Streptomyces iconiensis]MDJ1131440.1 sigma factor-like helix-turn-helix DNA-binding protein [Streptomyces iconiensis]
MRSPSEASRIATGDDGARPEYTAFRALYRERYLRYAFARLGRDSEVAALVQDVFDDLAVRWPEALRSPSPAALAWDLLTSKLSAAGGDGATGLLRARLPDGTADAVVLCRLCGMDVEEAADVMGIDASSVTSRLGMARRTLSATGAEERVRANPLFG